jgi:hypothetical protein
MGRGGKQAARAEGDSRDIDVEVKITFDPCDDFAGSWFDRLTMTHSSQPGHPEFVEGR